MMLQAVSWLKEAITTKGVVAALTHYMLEPGRMGATDGRVCAMHPVTYDGDATLLPGAPLERVLNSVGPEQDIKITWPESSTKAVLRAGKLRCTFSTVPRSEWPYDFDVMRGEVPWHPWTPELLEGLRTMEPFIGTNAQRIWSTCVAFQRGYLLATTNVAIGRYKITHPALADMNVLLPRWAYDFVMSHSTGLTHWGTAHDAWYFRWENGAWARCVGVVGDFPPGALAIIENNPVVQDTAHTVTPEFRTAFDQLAALTPDDTTNIVVTNATMEGGEETARVVLDVGLGGTVPFQSAWTLKYLLPVVDRAQYINFTNFPKPAGFVSADGVLDGVVLGRQL